MLGSVDGVQSKPTDPAAEVTLKSAGKGGINNTGIKLVPPSADSTTIEPDTTGLVTPGGILNVAWTSTWPLGAISNWLVLKSTSEPEMIP